MNFDKYSLVLVKENKIIFSSTESDLRPLIQCIKEGKSGDILYDKVIGLAAARLIIYSGIADKVIADVISEPALEYLNKNKIKAQQQKLVANILTEDKKDICPMEKKALSIEDDEEFYKEMLNVLSSSE